VHNQVKIWSTFRLVILTTLVVDFPGLFVKIKGIDVGHILCLIWHIPTVNQHFTFKNDSRMWVDLGNVDVGAYFLPLLGSNVVHENEITWVYRGYFTSKEINTVAVSYGSMGFEFDKLPLANIIEPGPGKLLALLWNVYSVEIGDHPLVSIKASVNVEMFFVDCRCMIGSRCNIFSLNLDLGPSGIKGVGEIGPNDNVRGFAIGMSLLFSRG